MTSKRGRWVALRDRKYANVGGIPSLVWLERGEVYWNGGPGYCPFSDSDFEVVREYDWPRHKPNNTAFYREFGPTPTDPLVQSAGWLAPDGRFWACESWQHRFYEQVLSYMVYGEYATYHSIESQGWIKIYPHGVCVRPFRWVDGEMHDLNVTPQQAETLLALVALDPTSEYGKRVSDQLQYFLKEDEDG